MSDTNHVIDTGVTGVISKVQLPSGGVYEIHDAKAIHSVAELGLSQALRFIGTVDSVEDLPSDAKPGDFYIVNVEGGNVEYVRTDDGEWELLGPAHDYATSKHIHEVTIEAHNQASEVTVTVPTVSVSDNKGKINGTAAAQKAELTKDKVLGEGTVFSTNIGGKGLGTVTKKYLSADVTSEQPVAVSSNGTAKAITGFGEHSKTSVVGSVTSTPVTVVTGINPNKKAAITGFGEHTTKEVVTGLGTPGKGDFLTGVDGTDGDVAIGVNTANAEAVKVNTYAGGAASASTWDFDVANGVLTITGKNGTPVQPESVTVSRLGTDGKGGYATTAKMGKAITGLTPHTDKAITGITPTTDNVIKTLGTATTHNFVDEVGPSTGDVVGSVDTDDKTVLIGLGEATTADALTGVKVTAQPTFKVALSTGDTGDTDDAEVVIGVGSATLTAETTAGAEDRIDAVINVVNAASEVVSTDDVVKSVTVVPGTTQATGTAAAQTWVADKITVKPTN